MGRWVSEWSWRGLVKMVCACLLLFVGMCFEWVSGVVSGVPVWLVGQSGVIDGVVGEQKETTGGLVGGRPAKLKRIGPSACTS